MIHNITTQEKEFNEIKNGKPFIIVKDNNLFTIGDGIIITLENTREQLDLTIDYTCKEKLFKEWIILSLVNPAIGR